MSLENKKIKVEYYKMAGTGNDFIMINCYKNNNEVLINRIKYKDFVKNICDRNIGIGADGVILLTLPKNNENNFDMTIINSDGSIAEMCGNGARCTTYFAFLSGIVNKSFMQFGTLAGNIQGGIIIDNEKKKFIKVKMIDIIGLDLTKKIDIPSLGYKEVYFINTGVPHAVIFVDDIENLDVKKIGKFIRFHDEFLPNGTNVNFVKILNNSHDIEVRTYERGVEGETLSCGSGSTASGIISGILKNLYTPISVHTKSGEILKIFFEKNIENNDIKIRNVFLEGEIKILNKGEFEIEY